MTGGGEQGGVAEGGTAFVHMLSLDRFAFDRPKFTSRELERLYRSGGLGDLKVELIDGRLLKKSPELPGVPPGRPPWTAAEFERMALSGGLGDLRTELIEGEIVKVSPQHAQHVFVKVALIKALERAIEAAGFDWLVWPEISVSYADDFQPMSDIVVWAPAGDPRKVRGALDPKLVRLIVEVSHTTLADDLGPKLSAYVRSGAPEQWVADLEGGRILQHAEPVGDAYARVVEQPFGATFAALTLPLTIDTSALADFRTE
jgi:Uma2 family endonuclease